MALLVEFFMPTYGQLLHIEELKRERQRYRMAVFRADGGIIGKWSCEACQSDHSEDCSPYLSVDACVESMKRAIDDHHRTDHDPP